MENPLDNSFDIEPLIHGSMKDKLPELELAIMLGYKLAFRKTFNLPGQGPVEMAYSSI